MVICVKGTKPFVELKANYPQILRLIIRKNIFNRKQTMYLGVIKRQQRLYRLGLRYRFGYRIRMRALR